MSKRETMQATITQPNGDPIGTFEFEDQGSIVIAISVKFPERSPLHKKALNMDDLKIGMNIERCNIHSGKKRRGGTGLINGEPFLRGTKYQDQQSAWMLPVVTTDYADRLVHADWFLSDMGVVPYEYPDGSSGHWNDQNYTLAVI